MSEADRVLARKRRIEDPPQDRLGTISVGLKVRYCNKQGCRQPVPIALKACPKCKGTDLGRETTSAINYFRFRGFPEDVAEKILLMYSDRPTSIPFTYPGHPSQFIRIGYECFQGKFHHCSNDWAYNQQTGLWEDQGRANRRMKDGLTWENIPCEPEKCPYMIGGKDPYLDGKLINKGQCGEHVTTHIWLYDIPSLQLVRVKSGGTGTIGNFITETRKILGLMGGRWQPVKLELRVKMIPRKYPDPKSGQLRSTEVPLIYIHFPKAVTALGPGDIVGLPSKTPALPPGHEVNNYDELIDGTRSLPAPTVTEVPATSLTELRGPDKMPPPQAEPLITEQTFTDYKEALEAIPKNQQTKTREIIRVMFAIEKGRKFKYLEEKKALRIIEFLKRIATNDDYRVPPEQYELQEYIWTLDHPDGILADDIIERFEIKHPDKAKVIRNAR